MGSAWLADKARADRFMPHVVSILTDTFRPLYHGATLRVEPASVEDDREIGADITILIVRANRGAHYRHVAYRWRDSAYLANPFYAHQMTVRESRPDGVDTELQKVFNSAYILNDFYGFGPESSDKLVCWGIFDLERFRSTRGQWESAIPPIYERRCNRDGSSTFLAFDVRRLNDFGIVYRASPGYADWLPPVGTRVRMRPRPDVGRCWYAGFEGTIVEHSSPTDRHPFPVSCTVELDHPPAGNPRLASWAPRIPGYAETMEVIS
jgi:hypothetical protein